MVYLFLVIRFIKKLGMGIVALAVLCSPRSILNYSMVEYIIEVPQLMDLLMTMQLIWITTVHLLAYHPPNTKLNGKPMMFHGSVAAKPLILILSNKKTNQIKPSRLLPLKPPVLSFQVILVPTTRETHLLILVW